MGDAPGEPNLIPDRRMPNQIRIRPLTNNQLHSIIQPTGTSLLLITDVSIRGLTCSAGLLYIMSCYVQVHFSQYEEEEKTRMDEKEFAEIVKELRQRMRPS